MINIFLTIFSGVSVFVIGQIIVKMFLEPVQEMKKIIAKIRMDIHRYDPIIQNCSVLEDTIKKEISDILSNLSAELIAHLEIIPFYKKTSKVFKLPESEKIKCASGNLMALSSFMLVPDHTNLGQKKLGYIIENLQNLKDSLGFHISENNRYDEETIKALKM